MKKCKLLIVALILMLAVAIAGCSSLPEYSNWTPPDNDSGYGNADDYGSVISISLTPSQWLLEMGDEIDLTATLTTTGNASSRVSWASSNSHIATIAGNGNTITLRTNGVAGITNVTATSVDDPTVYATAAITVVPPAQNDNSNSNSVDVRLISLNHANYVLNAGNIVQLIATVDAAGNISESDISWTTSNENVVAVNQNVGTIVSAVAVNPGVATITVYAAGRIANVVITVEPNIVLPNTISVTPSYFIAELGGGSFEITAIVGGAQGADESVRWYTSNDNVATVIGDGNTVAVATHAIGTTIFTAVSNSNPMLSATSTITVIAPPSNDAVESIALNHTSYSLYIGNKVQLIATASVVGNASQAVRWVSSNPSVADVSSSTGNTIYTLAISEGTTLISAISVFDENVRATVMIRVSRYIEEDVVFNVLPSPIGSFQLDYVDAPISAEDAERRGYPISTNPMRDVRYYTRHADALHDSLMDFGAHSNILFPGAIVTENLTPITLPRAPITVSMSSEGWTGLPVGTPLSRRVDSPSLSTTRDATRYLVYHNLTETANPAANLSWSIKEVNSQGSFDTALGIGARGWGANVRNSFGFSSNRQQTSLMITLERIFFEISIDRPGSALDFFADGVTNQQIRNAIPEGTVVKYTASVIYGKRVVISLQTDFSTQLVRNELEASFSGFGVSANTSFNLSTMLQDGQTQVSAAIMGGSITTANAISQAAAQNNLDGIIEAMFCSNINPIEMVGVPTGYRFHHLQDGTPAGVRSSSEHTTKVIEYRAERLLDFYHLDHMIDTGELVRTNELNLDFGGIRENNLVANRVITIPQNIRYVRLFGGNHIRGERIIRGLTLDIDNRHSPIYITVDSLSFEGRNYAIRSRNAIRTTLSVHRTVSLQAAQNHAAISVGDLKIMGSTDEGNYDLRIIGGNSNSRQFSGQSGINADNLTIYSLHETNRINIRGGRGSDGANVNGAQYWYRHGSAGGAAISARGSVMIRSLARDLVQLVGGSGGHGRQPSSSSSSDRNTRRGGSGGAGQSAIIANGVVNVQNVQANSGNAGNAASGSNATGGGHSGGLAGSPGQRQSPIRGSSIVRCANSRSAYGAAGQAGSNGANHQTCIVAGSMVTKASGEVVPVETLQPGDLLLVFCFLSGQFSAAPIIFIDVEPYAEYEVIDLEFSDGTVVSISYEHAFFNLSLNRFVWLRNYNAADFVGDYFKQYTVGAGGNREWSKVRLVNVDIYYMYTTLYSPVTFSHMNFYVNGILSAPGATQPFLNIFEVCQENMRFCQVSYSSLIEQYGLLTLEDFREMIHPDFPEMMFYAFSGRYLNISVMTGNTSWTEIIRLIEKYSAFLF